MPLGLSWTFLPFDRHLDSGFGAMAGVFKESADCLAMADDRPNGSDYVICYLLRHAIELSLKSMILTLHQSQNIPFPSYSKLGEPMIHGNAQLFKTHSLTTLFTHFERTITENWERIRQPQWTDWSNIPASISQGIPKADKLDPRSFGFRYPDRGDLANDLKNPSRNKPFVQILRDMHDDTKPAQQVLLMMDKSNNVIESFDLAPRMDAETLLFTQLSKELTAAAFGMHCEMTKSGQVQD